MKNYRLLSDKILHILPGIFDGKKNTVEHIDN